MGKYTTTITIQKLRVEYDILYTESIMYECHVMDETGYIKKKLC